MSKRVRPRGLALAGGGPFGAIYEIGALMALQESLEGLDLAGLDCYVGVSAGGFLAAALANGIGIDEIYRQFIEGGTEGALTPDLFMRPALREYLRRARMVPSLLAGFSFAGLGRAIPTGIFDNEVIHRYLAAVFSEPGRSNDFRRLGRRLYLVATDLDSGRSVSFGRRGHDHVPISKALQASAALPGLFPPVEIDGRHYVDGALRKTLHASEALDDGARLVICINPIVPFDATAARATLVEGGLPVVLSQTFRAVIHSRMAVGLSKYETQYRNADVVLFEPEPDDSTIFFTNLFSYSTRRRICEHAYERTRRDLLRRSGALAPVFARHGIRIRRDVLEDPHRLPQLASPRRGRTGTLPATADDLRATLQQLRRCLGEGSPQGA